MDSNQDGTQFAPSLALVRQSTLAVLTQRILWTDTLSGLMCFAFLCSAKPFAHVNDTPQCRQSRVLTISLSFASKFALAEKGI